jgi:hypothetical protein
MATSARRPRFSAARVLPLALGWPALVPAGPAAAGAQGTTAGGDRAPSTKVVSNVVGTTVGRILRADTLGPPVLRADGRYEQRYRIVANVPFILRSQNDTADEGIPDREPGASFTGSPGYHADVRLVSRTLPRPIDIVEQAAAADGTAVSPTPRRTPPRSLRPRS